MDVKTASRLYDLRRQKGMSQEDLADALGVTRQAVSKWERAESSPDTDNLIALAKLYNVSLDQLVGFEEIKNDSEREVPPEKEPDAEQKKDETDGGTEKEDKDFNFEINDKGSRIKFKLGDIDINDGKSTVKFGKDGLLVKDGKTFVKLGRDGIFVNDGEEDDGKCDHDCGCENGNENCNIHINKPHIVIHKKQNIFAIAGSVLMLLVGAAYVTLGVTMGLWHPLWLMFFAVPVLNGAAEAIAVKNIYKFPFVILCTGVYLTLGILLGVWHPAWVIFLAIPCYHSVIGIIKSARKKKIIIK